MALEPGDSMMAVLVLLVPLVLGVMMHLLSSTKPWRSVYVLPLFVEFGMKWQRGGGKVSGQGGTGQGRMHAHIFLACASHIAMHVCH